MINYVSSSDYIKTAFGAVLCALLVLDACSSQEVPVEQVVEQQPVALQSVQLFSQKVLPLLKQHCYECHSHEQGEAAGGLMLDSFATMQAGGSRGAVLDDSSLLNSSLLRALSYEDADLQMPPDGKLDAEAIDTFRNWLQSGASVTEEFAKYRTDAHSTENDTHTTSPLEHWAYQPLRAQTPLATDEKPVSSNVSLVDAHLERQLHAAGLSASTAASERIVLRRLYYDLTGLPPDFESLDDCRDRPATLEFVSKHADRLLASPRFGERWARHWMDVSRYADNKGYVFREDREYAQAYRYRDWLIEAFNQDMPYNDFIEHQLAADRLGQANVANLPALGFLTLGRRFLNNKFDIIDDRLDVIARGLMGMTLTCARCHDHKYDPITQKDYYALAGVLFNTQEPGGEPFAHRLEDTEKLADSFVLVRGSPQNIGEKVERRFVSFLAPDNRPFSDGAGRRELAEHIASADNPLTARVMVNRVWMQLMGTPLVETPSDFGLRCPAPVHQDLLDYLAVEFITSGWSVKRLIRTIVSSAAYRQLSEARAHASEIDPANTLYWRANRKRLDFEALRDTLLAVTGALDRKLLGESVPINQTAHSYRRTLYSYIDRQNLPSVFRTFDMATPDSHTPRRPQTSVPQQGLYFLNSDFVAELSLKLSQEPELRDRSALTEDKAVWLFQKVLGREPSKQELTLASDFIQRQLPPESLQPRSAWSCGYAKFDPGQNRISGFKLLPHFTGDAWQGSSQAPDPQLGWCILNAAGGHPGNDLSHAVVRRWRAPQDGDVVVHSELNHPSDQGDGVRCTVLLNGQMLKQQVVFHERLKMRQPRVAVKAGDHLDFVTDCRTSPNHDSFHWKIRIQYDQRQPFDSEAELPQPLPKRMDTWTQLAQALLATNELAFVD